MKPELSIVINSYKKPELLKLCIASFQKNLKEIPYEIIVADGETGEKTYDLMREKFFDVVFVPNHHNVGCAALVNQGIDAAKGEYLFIINADIVIKDKNILELVNYLKENPDVGMVGPELINFDDSVQLSCFRFYSPLTVIYRRTFLERFSFARRHLENFLMKKDLKENRVLDVDWLMGSAIMIPRKALDKVGKMDKSFFMYFEDVDWCWRFWENGFRVIYYPLVKVFHYHGKQSASQSVLKAVFLNKYTRIHILSALKFFLKHLWKKNPHNEYEKNRKA